NRLVASRCSSAASSPDSRWNSGPSGPEHSITPMPDFDDPFKPSDATVMRPRPGAGRRGSPDAAPPSPMRPLVPPPPRADPLPEGAFQFIGIGLNPLVRAASSLLLL